MNQTMFTALINNERVRPTPKLHQTNTAVCYECLQPVIARCGTQKIWHWAHATDSNCPAGQGETQWHLHWKTIVNLDETEVKLDAWPNNRADICMDLDTDYRVIELQHSPIDVSTIEAREAAYERMLWVVDVSSRDFTLSNYYDNKKFYWNYASKVWSDASQPVIFDNGRHWTLWLKSRWNKLGSGWFLLRDYDLKVARCIAFQRPSNREELVNLIADVDAALVEEQKQIAASDMKWQIVRNQIYSNISHFKGQAHYSGSAA
jgi:hypothetical protein